MGRSVFDIGSQHIGWASEIAANHWLNAKVSQPSKQATKPRSRLLPSLAAAWMGVFAYLLLVSDPPDIGPIRLRSFEDQGHLFGSLLLGLLLFLVLSRSALRAPRVALLSLGLTLAFLGTLELAQELRPGRGYQRLDIQLNLVGAFAGVGLAWIGKAFQNRLVRRRVDADEKPDPS